MDDVDQVFKRMGGFALFCGFLFVGGIALALVALKTKQYDKLLGPLGMIVAGIVLFLAVGYYHLSAIESEKSREVLEHLAARWDSVTSANASLSDLKKLGTPSSVVPYGSESSSVLKLTWSYTISENQVSGFVLWNQELGRVVGYEKPKGI